MQMIEKLLIVIFFNVVFGASSQRYFGPDEIMDSKVVVPDLPASRIVFRTAANLDSFQNVYLTSDECIYLGTPYLQEVPSLIEQKELEMVFSNCDFVLNLAFKEKLFIKDTARY